MRDAITVEDMEELRVLGSGMTEPGLTWVDKAWQSSLPGSAIDYARRVLVKEPRKRGLSSQSL